MRVQFEPAQNRNLYPKKENNNVNFRSLMYNPKSIVYRNSDVAQYLFNFLRKSVAVSKSLWQPIDKNIAPHLQQIDLKSKRQNSTIRLWDINKDNRTKYVIVMHGLCHNISSLQDVYKNILSKTNYGILAQEYSGFRNCDKEYKYLQPKTLLNDAELGLQYLKNKGIKEQDICILGHSFGGYVASMLSAKHKDIGSMILISPCYSMKTMTDRIAEGNESSASAEIRQKIKKHKIFEKFADKIFSMHKYIKKAQCPTDIIHSNKDRYSKFDMVQKLAKECKHLRQLQILPKGYHRMDNDKIEAIVSTLNQYY